MMAEKPPRQRRLTGWRPTAAQVAEALPRIIAATARAAEILSEQVDELSVHQRGVILAAVGCALVARRVRAADACRLLEISTATLYRHRKDASPTMRAAHRVACELLPDPPAPRDNRAAAMSALREGAEQESTTESEAATRNTVAAVRARARAIRILRERHRMPFSQIAAALGMTRAACSRLASGERERPDLRNPINRRTLAPCGSTS